MSFWKFSDFYGVTVELQVSRGSKSNKMHLRAGELGALFHLCPGVLNILLTNKMQLKARIVALQILHQNINY